MIHLHVESKNQTIKKKKQAHRYREQIDGCQRQVVGDEKTGWKGSKGADF